MPISLYLPRDFFPYIMLGLGNVIELLKRLLVVCGGYFSVRAHKIVVLVLRMPTTKLPRSTLKLMRLMEIFAAITISINVYATPSSYRLLLRFGAHQGGRPSLNLYGTVRPPHTTN